MKLWLKLIIVIEIISSLLIELNESKISEKDCDHRILDENVKSLLGVWVYKDNKWPENDAEMTEWCKSVQSGRRNAKSYVIDCLKGLPRPYMSVFISLAGRASRNYCKSKQERIDYIDKGKCGNAAKNDTNKCYNKMIAITENIRNLGNPRDKIPALCCSIYWLRDCFIKSFEKIGSPVCQQTNIEHMKQHYDKIATESIKLQCSAYKDPDQCVPYIKQIDTPEKYVGTYFPILFEVLRKLEF